MIQQDEHQALYRKWRPQNFNEVCGQTAITATLRQAVINKEISHAYLFAGTRGTGKTSLAKIFSRAINCLSPQDGNPCNQCNVCKAILDEQIMDVIEMDAASNNSVDNIRRLIEEVPFLPALAKYKVYIIDEVHMLSVSAFNALLKTLEEPPKHVVFILATTEPDKLPATILSRCQRYNFQRLSNEEISKHLTEIAASLNLTIEPACLNLIVKLADGSMRDAISLFDQCRISVADNSELKLIQLEKLLGKSDQHFVLNCLKAIQEQDSIKLAILINDLALSGLDYSRFLEDLAYCYRQLLLIVLSGVDNDHKFLDVEPQLLTELEALAQTITPNYCLSQMESLQRLISNLRYSSQARLSLEVGLLALLATKKQSKPSNTAQVQPTQETPPAHPSPQAKENVTAATPMAQVTQVAAPEIISDKNKISENSEKDSQHSAKESKESKEIYETPKSQELKKAKESQGREEDCQLDLHSLSDQLVEILQEQKQTSLSFLINLRPLEQKGNTIYLLFNKQENELLQITQSAAYQQALQAALEMATNSKRYQLKTASTDDLGNIIQANQQKECNNAEPDWLKKLQAYAQAEQLSFNIEEKQANTPSEW